MLALGDLCKAANNALNGDAASVEVLVRADVEQKCFMLEFQLVQDLFGSVTSLLGTDSVKDAKDILEWLGIIGGGATGVFGLYKFLSKKKPDDTVSITNNTEEGSVTYQIIGDGNSITVPESVDKIAQDPRALQAAKSLVSPLNREGYDSVSFEHDGNVASYISRAEAAAIVAVEQEVLLSARDGEHVSTIKTEVRIKRPVYELSLIHI